MRWPGGLWSHREQITRELIAVYKPGCNPEQYNQAWKDEWIGSYIAPTTGPLTTERDPSTGSVKPESQADAVCVATISAAIASAISCGFRALMWSPAGPCIRLRSVNPR